MKNAIRIAAFLLPQLAAASAQAADAPTLWNAKELKWIELAEPAGARQAVLWVDAGSADNGVLMRWKANSKAPGLVRTQDLHVVVFAGTLTVEVGGDHREFGPGGFLSIPKGMKHTLGCEAAGECRFVVHHPGAVEISKNK